MNIFVLDFDPILAAKYHNDKHCVAMVRETAQLLSSAHHVLNSDFVDGCYKLTHKNHPCSIWTRSSVDNYKWLYSLFTALSDEYTTRYNKVHKSFITCNESLSHVPTGLPNCGITEFPKCMPEYCKKPDVVESYRTLYMLDKAYFSTWKTNKPEWFT